MNWPAGAAAPAPEPRANSWTIDAIPGPAATGPATGPAGAAAAPAPFGRNAGTLDKAADICSAVGAGPWVAKTGAAPTPVNLRTAALRFAAACSADR